MAAFSAIFAALAAVYWPAIRGGMLWDDSSHITRYELQSWRGLWRIWFDLGATQQYYPVLHSAFWLEHRLWGGSVTGYHLLNLALHAVSALLVTAIVKRLTLPGAWLAGLVFAFHPVCVEGVAWISEQKDTLSCVFYLSAALAFLAFHRSRKRGDWRVAFALFALALGSKSVTATLPAALLIIIWFEQGKLEWARDLRPLVPWFAIGIPAGLFTAWVERTYIGARGADFDLTFPQRLLLAGRAICFYAGKVIWPSDLIFSYPHWTIDAADLAQYLYPAVVMLAGIICLVLARRRRGPLAAFLYFVGTLFPALGFFNVLPFRYSYVADHFQYLACLGIIVPLCVAAAHAARRYSVPKAVGATAAAALLAALAFNANRQSEMYRDSITLYRTIAQQNPDSWFAHNNLGSALFDSGNFSEAEMEFEAALWLKPDLGEAHDNLGNVFARMRGRLPDAIGEYRKAIELKPESPEPHVNLGIALARTGRESEAIGELETALRIQPSAPTTRANLGSVFLQLGQISEAIVQYRESLRLSPYDAVTHLNLAQALAKTTGGRAEAIAEAQTALRLNPGLQPARSLLQNLR